MRRKILAVVLAATAVAVGACFPQGQCQTPYQEYCFAGDKSCQGHIIDATHWESGPVYGAWLPYGPEATIKMHFRDAVTGDVLSGKIVDFSGRVGATAVQDPSGVFPGECATQLCEWLQDPADPTSVDVRNDTCSSEFFYVLVTIDPSTDAGATVEASTDAADDTTADAGTD